MSDDPMPSDLFARALYWLLLIASIAALGGASYEGFLAKAPLASVTLGSFVFALALVVAGIHVLSVGSIAFLCALLLGAQVEIAAIWLRGSPVPAFVLLKRGPAFWANAFHLAGVVLIGTLLMSRARTYLLRVVLFAVFGYCAAGFAVGLVAEAGLDVTMLGAGPLALLSDPLLQPAYVALTFVLPVAALCALLIWLSAIWRASWDLARMAFFLGLWAAMLVAGGAVLADWLYLPSVSWLIARPVGQGESRLGYTSPWRRNADGTRSHSLVLKTTAAPGARTVPWSIGATLASPPRPGESTVLYLGARHAPSGMALARLERASLALFDDGRPVPDFQLERLPPGGTAGALVLVVDLSPAAGDEQGRTLADLRGAVAALLDRLPPGWKVGLVTTGAQARSRLGFPADRRAVQGELGVPDAPGGHAVLDGLALARGLIAKADTELRAIVVFGAGADTASRRSVREELLASERARVPIHTVTMVPAPKAAPRAGTDLTGDTLLDLARATGGSCVRVERSADLPRAFAETTGHVAVTHRITFTRPRLAAPVPKLARPTGPVTTGPVEIEATAASAVTSGPALDHLVIDVVGQPVLESRTSPAVWRAKTGDLVDGTYPVSVTAVGADGALASANGNLVVKNLPPSPEILYPLAGARIHEPVQARVRVRGVATGPLEAWLDGVPAPVEAQESGEHHVFLAPGALGPGLHALRVRAANVAGACEDQVYFHVQLSAVEVALPGLAWNQLVIGPRAVEARVRSVPPQVAVTSVTAWVDRRPLATLTKPPFRFVLDGAAIADGGHQLIVRATNALGFSKDATTSYRAQRAGFGIHFPRLLQGNTITEKTRLVPVFTGAAKPVSVEFRIAGKLVSAGPPDFGVDIDPAEHPPGATRVNVRVMGPDAPIAETLLNLDLPQTSELVIPFAAVQGDRVLVGKELEAAAPKLTLDGLPVAAERVKLATATGPVGLVVVADASADMQEGNLLAGAREGIALLLEMQRPGDRVGLVALSGAARLVARPSSDPAAALAQLAQLEAAGSRPLHDGIAQALEALGSSRERQAVVVVAGGEDATQDGAAPGSGRSLEAVIERAQELGTPVFTVALGHGVRRHAGRGDRALARLARETGGTHRAIARPSKLSDALLELLEEVQAPTRMVVRAPAPTADGLHDVKVESGVAGLSFAVSTRVPER